MDNKLGIMIFVIKASPYSEQQICKNNSEQTVATQISTGAHTKWRVGRKAHFNCVEHSNLPQENCII